MGIAAGAKIRNEIHKDPYVVSSWYKRGAVLISVQILNSVAFEALTGMLTPPTPITPKMYQQKGLPFYADWAKNGVETDGADNLRGIKSVGEIDATGAPIQPGSNIAASRKLACTSCGSNLCDCM
jgi:hypothetical protein